MDSRARDAIRSRRLWRRRRESEGHYNQPYMLDQHQEEPSTSFQRRPAPLLQLPWKYRVGWNTTPLNYRPGRPRTLWSPSSGTNQNFRGQQGKTRGMGWHLPPTAHKSPQYPRTWPTGSNVLTSNYKRNGTPMRQTREYYHMNRSQLHKYQPEPIHYKSQVSDRFEFQFAQYNPGQVPCRCPQGVHCTSNLARTRKKKSNSQLYMQSKTNTGSTGSTGGHTLREHSMTSVSRPSTSTRVSSTSVSTDKQLLQELENDAQDHKLQVHTNNPNRVQNIRSGVETAESKLEVPVILKNRDNGGQLQIITSKTSNLSKYKVPKVVTCSAPEDTEKENRAPKTLIMKKKGINGNSHKPFAKSLKEDPRNALPQCPEKPTSRVCVGSLNKHITQESSKSLPDTPTYKIMMRKKNNLECKEENTSSSQSPKLESSDKKEYLIAKSVPLPKKLSSCMGNPECMYQITGVKSDKKVELSSSKGGNNNETDPFRYCQTNSNVGDKNCQKGVDQLTLSLHSLSIDKNLVQRRSVKNVALASISHMNTKGRRTSVTDNLYGKLSQNNGDKNTNEDPFGTKLSTPLQKTSTSPSKTQSRDKLSVPLDAPMPEHMTGKEMFTASAICPIVTNTKRNPTVAAIIAKSARRKANAMRKMSLDHGVNINAENLQQPASSGSIQGISFQAAQTSDELVNMKASGSGLGKITNTGDAHSSTSIQFQSTGKQAVPEKESKRLRTF